MHAHLATAPRRGARCVCSLQRRREARCVCSLQSTALKGLLHLNHTLSEGITGLGGREALPLCSRHCGCAIQCTSGFFCLPCVPGPWGGGGGRGCRQSGSLARPDRRRRVHCVSNYCPIRLLCHMVACRHKALPHAGPIRASKATHPPTCEHRLSQMVQVEVPQLTLWEAIHVLQLGLEVVGVDAHCGRR